jgi:GxxExxY protein
MMPRITKELVNALSYEIIGAAIEVHKQVGPGLLESVYQCCIQEEFKYRSLPNKAQMVIPITYREVTIDALLKADFFVDELIVVELKAVEKILPVHEAQLITYMKLLKAPKAIMINFNVANIFKEGQKTYLSEYYRDLPDE